MTNSAAGDMAEAGNWDIKEFCKDKWKLKVTVKWLSEPETIDISLY